MSNELSVLKTGVSFTSDTGEQISLTPQIVVETLLNGQSVTNSEMAVFLSMCQSKKLNPFNKDIYLMKYGSAPATFIVSKDVMLRRANNHPDYDGHQKGIIIVTENGEVIEREGGFYRKGKEELVGAWSKVYRKSKKYPTYVQVNYDEYEGRTKDGKPNNQWATKPATMITKVAESQALRDTFPEEFQGLYDEAEMQQADNPKPEKTTAKVPKQAPQVDRTEIVQLQSQLVEKLNSFKIELNGFLAKHNLGNHSTKEELEHALAVLVYEELETMMDTEGVVG